MQYKLLISTTITATLLAACSDDKPAEKKSEPVKLAAVSAEQMADEAEARYKSSSEAIADSEYRREGSSAIATITRPLPLQESAEPVTLTVTDTITYGQELRDQGVIARVERRITHGQRHRRPPATAQRPSCRQQYPQYLRRYLLPDSGRR